MQDAMADSTDTTTENSFFPYEYPTSGDAWAQFTLGTIQNACRPLSLHAQRAMAETAAQLNANRPDDVVAAAPAKTGELLALHLLSRVFRHIVNHYCTQENPAVLTRAQAALDQAHLADALPKTINTFLNLYPPSPILENRLTLEAFLQESTGPLTRQEECLRELILLRVAMANPAAINYRVLYDDAPLRQAVPYQGITDAFERFLATEEPLAETGMSLLDTLKAPFLAAPDSLLGQLAYVRGHWAIFLPEELLAHLQLTEGVLREETAFRGHGPGPSQALSFGDMGHDYPEVEAFTVDKDWMPNVVLLAKTVYVWLHQLSKEFGRPIERLDQIPDETLDDLARWGITSLWLIGLWERSSASKTIKRMTGNPEAEASAYSLYEYEIAHDLGGHAAYDNLRHRASLRGIRLASDMVPNHFGITSKWVYEHPDWFIQSHEPPFPGYTFTGANLSEHDRYEIQIEDGYWEQRDAAVVFRWHDKWEGRTRFIYHGNDGTSMPWNDTAQLDFMNAELREAVIQTILHVARMFPVIRFDAAMTLAKKHYQRLWFPKQGDEGAIPSRTAHGMTRGEFDAVFPKEFWREVVDRIAEEVPDTLLLAEAFWLMEGYFVRTLGMHRVYNSAFMNMLKMEENEKYRQTIANVLEFSPEILQRFVNFMNNPDEETAEMQFGKGDKYFGVAAMLVTMPGLPMLGHGQIEGFTEKYGMEYRRAYKDESIDTDLLHRHEREIFPLMRLRHLWSGAQNFALYNFTTGDGNVNDNVFAYSNRAGEERGLIIYNNAFTSTEGTLHHSTAINRGSGDAPNLHHISLSAALALNNDERCYYIVKDQCSNLEYLFYAPTLIQHGLTLPLEGYQYHAFIQWQEVIDMDNSWGRLHAQLQGKGVPNVHEAYQEMHLAPILGPFTEWMHGPRLERLLLEETNDTDWEIFERTLRGFLDAVTHFIQAPDLHEKQVAALLEAMDDALDLQNGIPNWKLYPAAKKFVESGLPQLAEEQFAFWRVPCLYAMLRHIGIAAHTDGEQEAIERTSGAWLHEWYLVKHLGQELAATEEAQQSAWADAQLTRIAIAHSERLMALPDAIWGPDLHELFTDNDVRSYLQMHYFGGRTYFNKELFERMWYMLFFCRLIGHPPANQDDKDAFMLVLDEIKTLCHVAADVGYDVERFLNAVK